MHKAYDMVEWVFMKNMMLKLGFHSRWVNLIMSCVSSMTYNVHYNSQEAYRFIPTRGIRQSDRSDHIIVLSL